MVERHCSGAVLAGGANARFGGTPKGLEIIDGRRVVDRALDALGGAVDERFLITNDPAIRESVSGVVSYADTRPERGSLVGLHSALAHARTAALVVAWDMPYLSADLLAHLRAVGERASAAAIPVGPTGPEPLCAYYPRAALPHVDRQLDAGDLRLSRLVATLDSAVLVPAEEVARFGPPELLFANVNTPADLVAARARAGADLYPPLDSLAEHR
jgi:molybdopterin-guanine dinucleotide biosynthesis protein A